MLIVDFIKQIGAGVLGLKIAITYPFGVKHLVVWPNLNPTLHD